VTGRTDASGAWPATLTLLRHGESAGNVARDRAESEGAEFIEIEARDMDVDLSAQGHDQADAIGRWLAGSGHAVPTVVLSSPYRRAVATAEIAAKSAGLDLEVVSDERLREREFGMLDRLTRRGIDARFPEEAAARTRLGKFYHRPPGGESWCDVGLRVRSVLDSIGREYADEDVLVVAHQVVIYMFRYVLEHLDESDVLEISRSNELANCSITSYERDPDLGRHGGMRLERFNSVAPLDDADAPVTAEPPRTSPGG
jgi:probable phosphoglycerate mutase